MANPTRTALGPVLALGLSLSLALPAVAQDEVTLDTVVATVNGETLTMTHVLDVYRQLPDQYAQLPLEVLYPGILDQLIQQRALAATIDPPSWLGASMENERASLLAFRAVEQLVDDNVTEEAITAAYEAQIADFEPTPEFNASHILVETEEKAAELIVMLNDGADFATLAQEHSTGPSGPRGGELGWFGPGMMVPPFEAAVASLEVGAVSAPVQTQFGWHVVKLNDSRMTQPPALEELRDDLAQQVQSTALEAALAAVQEAADITRTDGIDPNVLGSLTLE